MKMKNLSLLDDLIRPTDEKLFRSACDKLILRPEHAMGDCATHQYYGGCGAGEPHCITQIQPAVIVQAFAMMMRDIVPENG